MFKTGDIVDDRYEIKEKIGSGGGGIIYKAYHRNMRKDVALKLIKDASAEELENRSEIDLMKNLKSRYLPIFYDFVQNGDEVYTVMEYIDGHDIKRLVEMGKNFSEDEIVKCGIQLCEAAGELHSKRPPIIHGDIKPANVMITATGDVCLIDFNISAIMQGNKAAVKGYSKEYAAPEQTFTSKNYKQYVENPIEDEFHEETRFLLNETTNSSDTYTKTLLDNGKETEAKESAQAFIDFRTDIFGIGAVLYYMLTEHPPINGRPDFDTEVSAKLKRIITKAMSPVPDERYKNTDEMKADFYREETVKPEKSSKPKGRGKLIAGVACAAVAAAVVAAVAVNNKDNQNYVSDISDNTSEYETTTSLSTEDTYADEKITLESSETVTEKYSFQFIGKESGFRNTIWGMSQDEVKSLEELELVGQDDKLLVYRYPKDKINEFPTSSISNAKDNVVFGYMFDYTLPDQDVKYDLNGLFEIMILVGYDSEELRDSDYEKLIDEFNDNYGKSESGRNRVGVKYSDNQKNWSHSDNSYISVENTDDDDEYSIQISIFTHDYTISQSWRLYDSINSIYNSSK